MSLETAEHVHDAPVTDRKTAVSNEQSQKSSDSLGECGATDKTVAHVDNVEKLNIKRPGRYQRVVNYIKTLPWDSYAIGFFAIMGALIAWQLLSYYQVKFILSFENIPTPIVVGDQFLKLIVTEEFYKHIGASLQRIGIAFGMASLLGITIGVLMGRSRLFSGIMMPYIEILRPIPAVAWIPLAILMLPTEESSIIYITFLGAFFPVVLNTVHGVEQTSGSLIRAAQSLGASKLMIMWHVTLPGALPSIMAGLAIGMGVAWFSLLAGEIISGQYGIGYFTWNSYTLVEYPNIIIGMLTIGGLGTLSTWLVKKASIPALRWQEHKD
ncbi:MAG: ABC transporter permease [Thioalkalispiraceae bacterium]|jgi:NitT/TauT family transport system permease protein